MCRGGRSIGLRGLLAAALGTMCMISGCYTYRPIGAPSVARSGDELRIHLTADGTTELTRFLGPRVAALDAELVRIDADSTMMLGVSMLQFTDGTSYPFTGQDPIRVSPVYIGSVERRSFSGGRTTVMSTAVVAGLIAVARAALHTGHVSPGGGPGGPPPP